MARVKEIFSIIGSGTTPKSGDEQYYDDCGYNWLQTGDLNDGYIFETSKKITEKALNDYSVLKFYPQNSLVIAMYGATIGKVGILKIETTVNQACCVLSTPKNAFLKYIYYCFLCKKQYILSLAVGGGQPNISQDIIKNLSFPLPDLPTQQRIADYLDKQTEMIDKKISLLAQKIEKYKLLKKTIINNAVCGEGKDWEWVRVKDVITLVKDKSISNHKLALENIEEETGRFIETDTEFDGNGVQFIKGDIVYGKLRPYLRKVWLATFEGNAVGDVFVFRCGKKSHQKYFKYFFLSEHFTSLCNGSTQGAKMPRVDSDFILTMSMPLPSFEEQNQIAVYLESKTSKIDAIVYNLQKQIEKYKMLKRAVIDKAVGGEL